MKFLLLAVALLALYLVFKARGYQRDHKDANERAGARLDQIQTDVEAQCRHWPREQAPSSEVKAALKQGLGHAYRYGAELAGAQSLSLDGDGDRRLRALLTDYLSRDTDGERGRQRYHTALHCALLLGQAAANPKMADSLRYQADKLQTRLRQADSH